LAAEDVAHAIEQGLKLVAPEIETVRLPLCDGGTGLVKRVTEHSNGAIKHCTVSGPLGKPVNAFYGCATVGSNKIAIIESAAAAGLSLVPRDQRDPRYTTTFGVGELVKLCLDEEYSELVIGCGDSATNDGGFGLAKALGARFLDRNGNEPENGGGNLVHLTDIDLDDLDPRVLNTKITVACNLSSVLCGENGTSYVYGPQKGANEESVELLAQGLENYASVIREVTGKDVRFIPGGGGAGGLATALYAFFNARLRFSFHVVTRFLELERYLENSDVVITGEGRIDSKTASGKIVCALGLTAKRFDLPVLAITGSVSDDCGILYYNGIDHIEPIATGPCSLDDSIARARILIIEAAIRVGRLLKLGNSV
jgi:glycerate kinase